MASLLPIGSRALSRAQFPPDDSFQSHDFGAGYITFINDTDVPNNAITGGQNMDINGTSLEKRKGHTLYGSVTGYTTQVLGMIAHEPPGGTAELLRVYDTTIERYVAGTWTALTSVTMTTNLPADSAYFPLTAKTYVLNGTDSVVKYTSGTAGDQTDAAFKKGKYICEYKNRLIVAGVSGQADYFWYTDLGVDTFSANNYVRVNGEITGVKVIYDKLIIFTKNRTYVCQNFSFNGAAAGPESVLPLRGDIGCIAHRTWQVVGNIGYFLGISTEGIAAVYATDGLTIGNEPISLPVYPDFNALAPAQLTNACSGQYGRYYRISLTPTGQTINTLEYIYDTSKKRWIPPYTNNVGGFSSYINFTVSGQRFLFAGSQAGSLSYQLNVADYDETINESFTTIGAVDTAVDANPAKRGAQSFKLTHYALTDSVAINGVYLRLKKNAGTTTGLTVRIETDNNGIPSGTLADADATTTLAAVTSTSYAYYKAIFTNVTLSGATTYWIVLKHTTEATGNSQVYWSGHATGTYTSGKAANYAGSTASNTNLFNPSLTAYAYQYTAAGDTFANIRSGAGNAVSPAGSLGVAIQSAGTANLFIDIVRSFLIFNTASIPDDASITAASLQLYCQYTNDAYTQSVGITSGTPASDSAIVSGDYAIANFGSTRFATDTAISAITTGAYNTWTLNASGRSAISLTGNTRLALRISADIDNISPNNAAGVVANSQAGFAGSGSAFPPILSITYSSATGDFFWTAVAGQDENFAVIEQGAIDGYADTAAFHLSPIGQKYHLKDLFVDAKASGSYNIQVGVNTGDYNSYNYQDMSVASNGPIFGSTLTIGTSVLGGQLRSEQRLRFPSTRGYLFKARFRNRFANQPFKIYGFRTRHEIIPKIK